MAKEKNKRDEGVQHICIAYSLPHLPSLCSQLGYRSPPPSLLLTLLLSITPHIGRLNIFPPLVKTSHLEPPISAADIDTELLGVENTRCQHQGYTSSNL